MTVSVSTLKARLSEVLRRVKGGDEVIITERGRPVARLVPLEEPSQASARFDELVAAGQVRPGAGVLPSGFAAVPLEVEDPQGRVLEALLEERRDGR